MPHLTNNFRYTFICRRKATLDRISWNEMLQIDEALKHNHKKTFYNFEACFKYCPNENAKKETSKCPEFVKALKEERNEIQNGTKNAKRNLIKYLKKSVEDQESIKLRLLRGMKPEKIQILVEIKSRIKSMVDQRSVELRL